MLTPTITSLRFIRLNTIYFHNTNVYLLRKIIRIKPKCVYPDPDVSNVPNKNIYVDYVRRFML